jgi:ATP-dependent DNA ligase
VSLRSSGRCWDLTGLPLVERKRRLDELHLVGPAWITNGCYPGDDDTLFQVGAELGHEGAVAKRLDAPYLPGIRSRTWLKRKCPAWKQINRDADHGYRPKSKLSHYN